MQVEMVCLDELVPASDRLRQLDVLVDLGVRAGRGGAERGALLPMLSPAAR